jgi:peptidoglycan/xylan/chitin deacetylase (PgdA/CDA1 family)
MSHRDLAKMSTPEKKKEIIGVQNWIAKCGIPKTSIWGHRSPFLSDDPEVRTILDSAGYKYDTSIAEVYDSPTSPSAQKRLLPYSMTKGVAQLYSCKWFDNINHCTSEERHPRLMEIPMWMYQKSSDTPSSNDLMDPPNPYKVLKAEFDRNYAANRAPVGIWTHTSTGYLTKQ